jgi:hypothetical protein
MGTSVQVSRFTTTQSDLRHILNRGSESTAVFWRINGFRARLMVWTVEEWDKLELRPADAQYHPSGVWCVLRLD